MTYSSYRVKVPGKLLIAGEYAVLEPNQKAVVAAVDRYVSAYIEPSTQNLLSLPELELDNITWDLNDRVVQLTEEDSRLAFVQQSLQITNQFLREISIEPKPFRLTIKSQLNDLETGRKYGLGSSAAVVVATVSAILSFHQDEKSPFTLDQVFKLSALAHLKTQKNGSGADIAASTYGGWLAYSAFDANWVLTELVQSAKLTDLIAKKWPYLSITPLNSPRTLKLCVGWTKETASTPKMINKIETLRKKNPASYKQFLTESAMAVDQLIHSFTDNDCSMAISSLREGRNALVKLGEKAEVTIETKKLRDLCAAAESYGSGKSSGAGGGDCGIAFIDNEAREEELYKKWIKKDIKPLDLTVSAIGAEFTEYNCEPSMEKYFCHS